MRRILRAKRPSGLLPASRLGHSAQQPASALLSSRAHHVTMRQKPTTTATARPLHRLYSSTPENNKSTPSSMPSDKKQAPSTPGATTTVVDEIEIKEPRESSSENPSTEIAEAAPEDELEGEGEEWVDAPEAELSVYRIPPPRTEAPYAEGVQDVNYVPAMTAEGLDTVGPLKGWWNNAGNWNKEMGSYVGFRPSKKVLSELEVECAVRRAVVEALAVRQAGREDLLVSQWAGSGFRRGMDPVLTWDLKVSDQGVASLSGGDAAALVDELEIKSGDAVPLGDGTVLDQTQISEDSPEEIGIPSPATTQLSHDYLLGAQSHWDRSWEFVSLRDDRLRFAVLKRVFQLTGHRIHDHELSAVKNVRALLTMLRTPPKPKTLTKDIQLNHETLTELPNVHFAGKRITRGDKEKALGRLKIMQEELKKRGLPLTGHGGTMRNRELRRLKGGI